jgi:hypothetical protein
MNFETYFKAFSYAMISIAMLALVLAGGLNYGLALLFVVLMIVAWKCEDTKWQLSERTGLLTVLLSIPLFYLDWQYQKAIGEPVERLGVNALAHLIVFLSGVKLLQVKKDRDWVFLYLISFFEILLAAGLSFSPVFLATLTLYLLCGLSAVTAFEIQKAKRAIVKAETRLLVAPDSRVFRRKVNRRTWSWRSTEAIRLPFVAFGLLVLIFVLALPLFLIAPRSGAALLTRSGGGLSHFIGFSDSVTLGEIGELKQDNETVMRIRLDTPNAGRELRWRGVALDEFTGRGWKKSSEVRRNEEKREGTGFYQLGTTEALHHLTTQTVFLEPLESPVLFLASRGVAIQSDFPFVRIDKEGGTVQYRRHEGDRLIYKAISDTTEPAADALRRDMQPYAAESRRYLQLPEKLDPRIDPLVNAIFVNSHVRNRYDAAKAIESHLQTDYGYSLKMRASGPDPLADFLFNVKAGHCEYFSTAMAVMLRTRGVAARVVNGFLPGEYNEAAGAYTVRQSDAHSWVEVYFPENDSWVTFDPTPPAGKTEPVRQGFAAQLEKYAEALELVWFQYVVGYDKQEQRSLATSLHNHLFDYGRFVSQTMAAIETKFPANIRTAVFAGLALLILAVLAILFRRVRSLGWRRALRISARETNDESSTVVFYERLTALLAQRGMLRDSHLTPLEFANTIDVGEALLVTRAYNRVRFGREKLSPEELVEIDRVLVNLED